MLSDLETSNTRKVYNDLQFRRVPIIRPEMHQQVIRLLKMFHKKEISQGWGGTHKSQIKWK